MKIRCSIKAEGRLMWKGEEVCIDKIRFRMKELSVVHGLNESARRGLMEDLLLVEGGRPVKKPIAPVGFGPVV